MTTPRKLTNAESGRLGGLTAAEKMTPEQRERRASKGGASLVEQRGRSHMTRLAHKRWGRLETSPASVTERAADQGAALVEGVGRRRPNEDS